MCIDVTAIGKGHAIGKPLRGWNDTVIGSPDSDVNGGYTSPARSRAVVFQQGSVIVYALVLFIDVVDAHLQVNDSSPDCSPSCWEVSLHLENVHQKLLGWLPEGLELHVECSQAVLRHQSHDAVAPPAALTHDTKQSKLMRELSLALK